MPEPESFQIRILQSLSEVEARQWNRLAGFKPGPDGHGNPFLSHEFLHALEESGSASPATGWLGQHLLLEKPGEAAIAAMPCYLKSHSQGEYVFDHGWADAYERAGGRYYPKLQSCVPFTPATGPRLLTGSAPENTDVLRQALLSGLQQLTEKRQASSAHLTFMPEAEWHAAGKAGYLLRTDRQFHWQNEDYRDFETFLGSLSSRKRKAIRRERKPFLDSSGITIDWLTGSDLTEDVWDRFFEFYIDTGSRKWGRPYLTRSFFSLVGEKLPDNILLVMARRDRKYIAGAINFISSDCLFGRHWGCLEHVDFLHFEVCYYQAMEYAIAHGLARVEAGAQGEHKLARGYVPVTTRSAHHIDHPGLRNAVADYLEMERRQVSLEKEILAEHAPFRKTR